MDIEATLAERGSRYGSFPEQARIVQNLKRAMQDSPNWLKLRDDQKEALEMVALKVSRILNGDPDYYDSWYDMIGYTKLVANTLVTKKRRNQRNGERSKHEPHRKLRTKIEGGRGVVPRPVEGMVRRLTEKEMHCTKLEHPKAKKQHKCMSCGEQIAIGDEYVRWRCFMDGSVSTNRMHRDCYDMHDADGGEWEYSPFNYERPVALTPNAGLTGGFIASPARSVG